ncbi:Flp family type IVb pilin [Pseudomonas sp. N040]|uniref:Flp family type IVb pilin n=1 Tax=Pseudomonas sp. N040 TaxID=2785325 RepID=UPI0018A24C93|nr:Flp family type IVb pilin [Pseudomonas sp. N040]MBF7728654.1 Flp family type IVb pilin [Pseudomonas sp. N040]MBW7012294.1 Flp family type IVb pilin [Pseudomonas sp. N040]
MNLQMIKTAVLKFLQDEEGLTTVEYAVAGALVAGATVIAFTDLGTAVANAITDLTDAINGP